jgi:hypothetical protein
MGLNNMATNTYVALDETTVGTAVPSITFTSIPSGYTDLVLVSSVKSNGTSNDLRIVLNTSANANYSFTQLYGNGTSAFSNRGSSETNGYLGGVNASGGNFETVITQFQGYSNGTTFTTWLSRSNQAGSYVNATVGLWRYVDVINSIEVYIPSNNIAAGSTFSLYGIKAQVTPGTAKATGGTITYDQSGNVIHTFTSSGTFTPTSNISNVEYLVVAGGGGGSYGGAGGAGGYRSSVLGENSGGNSFPESTLTCSSGVGLTVTVGAGGAGSTTDGSKGSNSVFSTITAEGGGLGTYRTGGIPAVAGGNGGSGGGAGGQSGTTAGASGGTATASQGSNGGSFSTGANGGGGGGGASAVGTGITANVGGNGGAGLPSAISGSWVTRAGGGGGAGSSTSGSAGTGGGGAGSTGGTGSSGTANTGGGAGGGWTSGGGTGGSGIVIIRYSGL